MVAASEGHTKIVKMLLEKEAPINARDKVTISLSFPNHLLTSVTYIGRSNCIDMGL